jgi:hypothetical protein
MSLNVQSITFDCANPLELAQFWAQALGYKLDEGSNNEEALLTDPRGQGTDVLFLTVPEGKSAKNRLHLDLRPTTTMQAEVERLEALGAQRAAPFQDIKSWTVLYDPEGNEFCVVRSTQEREQTS